MKPTGNLFLESWVGLIEESNLKRSGATAPCCILEFAFSKRCLLKRMAIALVGHCSQSIPASSVSQKVQSHAKHAKMDDGRLSAFARVIPTLYSGAVFRTSDRWLEKSAVRLNIDLHGAENLSLNLSYLLRFQNLDEGASTLAAILRSMSVIAG